MRLYISTGVFSLIVAGTALLGGCAGGGQLGAPSTNEAGISLSFPEGYTYDRSTQALYPPSGQSMASLPPYVTGISLTISGEGMDTLVLPVNLATLSVSFSITPGLRTFTVIIYTDRGVTFTDTITIEVVTGASLNLAFDLLVNISPSINSISASPAKAKPGDVISLACSASDPDPDDKLAYKWSGPGGWTAEGQQASFTIPNYGVFSFTCAVSDGRGGAATASVTVNAPAPPPANSPPVVVLTNSWVSTCNYDLVCSATDADGDPLTFSFATTGSATCLQTGMGANSRNLNCNGCSPDTVKCSVSDGVNAPVAATFAFSF
ncbi:MAG: hypothetical protein OEZ32_02880 [Nitrospinota bacterium]|nr:hypothetical protein [Nitrospinota bacterium]